jgi:hypothetical protein
MNRIKNTIGLRKEMEDSYQLGLNAFGTFVKASLDEDELNHLQSVYFGNIQWTEEFFALEIRGTRKKGCLVKFAKLSPDHRYCYLPERFRYLSPELLQAEPEPIPDFLKRIQGNKSLRIFQAKSRQEYVGILVGEMDASYKSLVVLKGDRIAAENIEENPPPQYSQSKTIIREENPPEGKEVLRQLMDLYC